MTVYGWYGTPAHILFACPHLPLAASPSVSFPASPLFLLPHPHPPLVLFYLPILDKSKAHIAREQLVSAISNHYCPSQSPSFLQPIFLYSRHRINPTLLWEMHRHFNAEGPSESTFYLYFASVKPSVCHAALSYIFFFFLLVLFLYHLT